MPQWLELLIEGTLVTLKITGGGAIVAALLAFTAGLCRLSKDPILRTVARLYVELFRGTSALVQLFWFVYALPMLLGFRVDPELAGILVLGLNVGAYGAEVVRGAIVAIPKGQHEAGIALNLTPVQRMRHIILPQALLAMIPPFGNLLIELLKASALVSIVGIADLAFNGDLIRAHTLSTSAVYGGLLVIYFLIALAITFGMRKLEAHLAHGRDHGGAH